MPRDPELLFRAGTIYRTLGKLDTAEHCYRLLLIGRETGHIDSLDTSMTGFKAYHNLALLYQDMGRLSEAEAQWRAAVTDNPQFVPSWLGLAEFYAKSRRFEDARGVAKTIAAFAPDASEDLQRRIDEAIR